MWYKELTALNDNLKDRGLQILAFPCNQFGAQEPGTAVEAEACVRAKFSVSFQLLEKVHVNGGETHPIYQWLRVQGSKKADAIPWNFSMFLVGRDGETCTRFSNTRTPSSIRTEIEKALECEAPKLSEL